MAFSPGLMVSLSPWKIPLKTINFIASREKSWIVVSDQFGKRFQMIAKLLSLIYFDEIQCLGNQKLKLQRLAAISLCLSAQ